MIAVSDTNIFMAALLNPSGAPAKIRRRWRQRQFEVLISDAILDEYSDVFSHSLIIPEIDTQLLLDELKSFSRRTKIGGTLRVCKDSDDDKFLETAVEGGADFLVTKNLKHFPRKSYGGVRIVNVANFLKALERHSLSSS
ncbi:MAG: putative toxin-antitoxin system toxin component, PIN family [bacterium]